MKPQKVLVVEDELIVQMHLARIVGSMGHEVVGTATNTAEALQAAELRAPDAVLMDVQLRGGDDGIETAVKLRSRYDCAIVLITADADNATVQRAEPVGAVGYVVKPFSDAEVRATLTTAIAGHGRLCRARARERQMSVALREAGGALLIADPAGELTYSSPSAGKYVAAGTLAAQAGPLLGALRGATEADEVELRAVVERCLRERRSGALEQVRLVGRAGQEHLVGVAVEPAFEGDEFSGLLVRLREGDEPPAPRGPLRQFEPRPFGESTRLMVYSHDTFGLGHLRRSLNLIRGLSQHFPDLSTLLVTGSPVAHRFTLPERTDYIKLPAVKKVAPESYEARSISLTGVGIHTMRSNLLLNAVRDFDPNVLLVDHAPTGMKGELLPSLEWLHRANSCQCILGLRDIIDDPRTVVPAWREQGIYDVLRELYDDVVVYGHPAVYDTIQEYAFPADVAAKTSYVHYVTDWNVPEVSAHASGGDEPLVVVSVGGGDGGAEAVIGTFLEMLRDFPGRIPFRSRILTGPFLSSQLERRFRESLGSLPVELETFVPSAPALFRSADLVVSTAGYNTVTEVLAHAPRSILIPRVLHRKEQWLRAARLQELGLCTFLDPGGLSPAELRRAVLAELDGPPRLGRGAALSVPLDGVEEFARHCGGLRVPVHVAERASREAAQDHAVQGLDGSPGAGLTDGLGRWRS